MKAVFFVILAVLIGATSARSYRNLKGGCYRIENICV